MIARLSSPSTATTVFLTGELPEAIHNHVFQTVVIPRVASWSMTPTIQNGDRLELERADTLHVGDVVIYRHDHLFVCHRIQRIEGSRLCLRGDASDGPAEYISSHEVVGRVTVLLRDGERIAISPYAPSNTNLTGQSEPNRYSAWSHEQGRSLVLRLIGVVTTSPLLNSIVRHILRNMVSIDMLEQAPLQSLEGYINKGSVRLCQADRFETHLSTSNTDLSRIILIIRVGSFHLGTCRLQPWNLQLRPVATALGLESLFQSFRVFLASTRPQ